MSEPNYMWGNVFPAAGQRDFTEKDMVKVSALHLESQAEIVALRAENGQILTVLDSIARVLNSGATLSAARTGEPVVITPNVRSGMLIDYTRPDVDTLRARVAELEAALTMLADGSTPWIDSNTGKPIRKSWQVMADYAGIVLGKQP